MPDDVAAVRALAVRLAREAGAIQRERYETAIEVSSKSRPIDLVTEVDRACEAHMVETLRRERPGDDILAEEGGAHTGGGKAWRWVIDPLDGTVNYAHGYPCFCVSIGVEHEGVRTVGVVYDPLRDELFEAVRGGGALRNGRPIRVSAVASIGRALLSTGFAYDVQDSEHDNLAQFVRAVKSSGGVRRDGSAALDLCYVACGRFDAFWELKLHPWDVAAGILLVEEAGGRVTDLAGGPPPASGREIASSNGLLHDDLLRVLRG
ncbi:MAG: inositol monophosphatase [Proteobacteria bacterium]|nr:MAG: inositol monophosphatase [Pseudomonadota bacterium]